MSYRARPVLIALHVDNPQQTAEFYSNLVGVKFARSLNKEYISYHAPISSDGILLQVGQSTKGHRNQTVIYFAVRNLEEAISEAETGGAKLTVEPFDLKITPEVYGHYEHHYQSEFTGRKAHTSLGRSCIIKSPSGESVGLIQLDPHAEVFFTRHESGATPWSSHPHLARHSTSIVLAEKHASVVK